MTLRYLSVCSGIEAATVAWHPLGWQPVAFSEIEPFPSAVLAHHYPSVPNWGDMSKFQEWPDESIDLLVGGTPCQSFSVAGLRKGLEDPRGNLMLTYLAIAQRYRPRWLVWENVPGVLSSGGGRDFGTFLGALGELGYGWAYRVLDAQWFGVAQRRRRVFVVGHLGDWQRAAAVLFERDCLSGHPPPRREAGQRVAPTISARTEGGGGLGTDFDLDGGLIARCVTTREGAAYDAETTTLIAHALRADGFDASEDGTGRGTPLVPVQPYMLAVRGRGDTHQLEYRQDGTSNAILTPNGGRAGMGVGAIAYAIQERAGSENPDAGPDGAGYREGAAYTLEARQTPQAVAYNITPSQSNKDYNARASERSQAITGNGNRPSARGGEVIAFSAKDHGADAGEMAPTLRAGGHAKSHANAGVMPAIMSRSAVRRLTPMECERLQGFPDDYTLISHRGKPAADGPRYKALGNSMAVPVMRWIGERIAMVEALTQARAA